MDAGSLTLILLKKLLKVYAKSKPNSAHSIVFFKSVADVGKFFTSIFSLKAIL